MNIIFKNKEHELFTYSLAKKVNCLNDPERFCYFYLIGLSESCRKHIDMLYDFEDNHVIRYDLNTDFDYGWMTGSDYNLLALAYDLYGCKKADGITDIFADSDREFMIHALNIRFAL